MKRNELASGWPGAARAHRLAAALTALAGAAFWAASSLAATPPPARAFVYGTEFDTATLSPDGRYVAMQRETSGGRKIVIFEPGQTQPARILNVSPTDTLRSLWWADPATLVAGLSTTVRVTDNYKIVQADEGRSDKARASQIFTMYRAVAAEVKGGAPRPLPDDNVLRGYTVAVGNRRSQPGTVVVQTDGYSVADGGFVTSLLEVEARTGKARVVERGSFYTGRFLLDDDGVPVARSDWREYTQEYSVLARNPGPRPWRTVLTIKGREQASLAGLTPDGKSIVVAAEQGGPNVRLWAVPRDGSSAPEVLYEAPGADVTPLSTPDSPAVLGYQVDGLWPEKHWSDKALAARQRSLDAAFPGRQVEIADQSDDGNRVLVRVDSPSVPPSYYLVDFASGRADLLGDAAPALAGARLAEVRALNYLARDGATIPAYLFVPQGGKPENLPTVVLPHGGPELRDFSFHFDRFAQFLATRGYAVLQPQFRGSTGFGRAHRLAGYGEWGGRMQDDVTDGVRHLIATGIARPDKVCIVGASYGGYAALAGAVFTPELFACAASINGISDLPKMIGDISDTSGEGSARVRYWREHIGSASDPRVAARSPARAAAQARAPILLLHAEFDNVVPRTQSELMATSLREAGKPVEYHALKSEDHWLSSPASQLEVFERLETFLATHLGGADTTQE